MTILKNNVRIWISSVALAIGSGWALAQPNPTPEGVELSAKQRQVQAQLQEIEQEFRDIGAKLRSIEQNALARDGVAEAQDTYRSMVVEGIVEAKPELSDSLEKRAEYVSYMQAVRNGEALPDGMTSDEIISEYNRLHQKISPVEQEVMRDPAVQEAFHNFQQRLVSTMQQIDGNSQNYLARQNELRQTYQQLVEELQG